MEHQLENNSEPDSINVKSVVLTSHGSFENIKVIDWPLRKHCSELEIKVAVEYCGVNFADVYNVHGRLMQKPVPFVLGLECAGKIIQLGDNTPGFKVGDRVVCYLPEGGLFRETVIVPSMNCFIVPHDVCNKIACTLMANYLTAYFALFEMGNLRPCQTVLVHSAAGGVGWAVTQLANKLVKDVQVVGTASESKHVYIKENGVSHALIYDQYETQIPKGSVNLIIDNIGGENLVKSIDLLCPLGKVIVTGANCVVQEEEGAAAEALLSLQSATVPTHSLVVGNKSVSGLHLGTLFRAQPEVVIAVAATVFNLCQQGIIEPRVHTVLPFAKAAEAIKSLSLRKNIGKVLLKVN